MSKNMFLLIMKKEIKLYILTSNLEEII